MKRILLCMLALLAMTGCARAQNLRVDFYDVGKADAMLITTPAGARILIDAATNKEGEKLVKRLQKEGVRQIDAMIITHFDKDHVGGADKMLESFSVGTVVIPVYDKESKQHTQFLEALKKHPPQEVVSLPAASQWVMEGEEGLTLYITSAHENDYGSDEENDFSLAVRMAYGDTKFLFAGDAENARQKELIREGDIACDVLKVPYHGRYEKSSPAFLRAASPKIAFICDDKDDPEETAVVEILEGLGSEVYCAKDEGSIRVLSDGKKVWAE